MGKTTKQHDAEDRQKQEEAQAATDRQAAIDARAPLRARIAARRAAIDNKDFDNAPDFTSSRYLSTLRDQQMENTADLTSTGVAGLASSQADPTAVKQSSMLLKDRQAQVSGARFDEDKNKYINDTTGMETDLANADAGIYSSFYQQDQANAYAQQKIATDIAMSKANILPNILGAGISGAASIASAYAGAPHIAPSGGR